MLILAASAARGAKWLQQVTLVTEGERVDLRHVITCRTRVTDVTLATGTAIPVAVPRRTTASAACACLSAAGYSSVRRIASGSTWHTHVLDVPLVPIPELGSKMTPGPLSDDRAMRIGCLCRPSRHAPPLNFCWRERWGGLGRRGYSGLRRANVGG